MQREKSIIIIGILGGLIIGLIIGYVWAYNGVTKRLPSETELPDQTILFKQKDLREVKAFLNKYPQATIQVDRSGRLSADYMVDNVSLYPNATTKWGDNIGKYLIIDSNGVAIGEVHQLMLVVSVDHEGKPQEISVRCSGRPTIYNFLSSPSVNVLSYIQTGNCLNLD